jgi:hypothetical protein
MLCNDDLNISLAPTAQRSKCNWVTNLSTPAYMAPVGLVVGQWSDTGLDECRDVNSGTGI